jgi:hypothetical protein
MPAGRPKLKLTEAEQADLLQHVATGGGLYKWCVKNNHHYAAVNGFVALDPEFSPKYARAREDQADYFADEIVEISDDGSRDYKQTDDGRIVPDQDHIARSRLRVDSRKWLASKLKPKKYSEKLAVGGADDLGAIETVTKLVVVGVAAPTKEAAKDG